MLAVSLYGIRAFAQSASDHRFETLMQNLKSGRWEERSSAFYSLLSEYPKLEAAKPAAVGLLVRENLLVGTIRQVSEPYSDYYGDLIREVASFHDSTSLQALLGCITTGDMATRGLAALGALALDPITARLGDSDSNVRQAATIVLSEMLDWQKTSAPGQVPLARVKQGLMKAASDEYPYVRMAAIEGLAKVDGPDVRILLEKLAAEDPYEASSHGGEKGNYPVRRSARELLSHLQGAQID